MNKVDAQPAASRSAVEHSRSLRAVVTALERSRFNLDEHPGDDCAKGWNHGVEYAIRLVQQADHDLDADFDDEPTTLPRWPMDIDHRFDFGGGDA